MNKINEIDEIINCNVCQYKIWIEEDEKIIHFQDNKFCEGCWKENVCHICGSTHSDPEYLYCELCDKSIGINCICIVISSPQYHGVICRICFPKDKYRCSLCNTDLHDVVKNSNVSYCDGNTYNNKQQKCGEMLCKDCV